MKFEEVTKLLESRNFTVTLFSWDSLTLIWFDLKKKCVEIHDRCVIYGEFNIVKKQENLGLWKYFIWPLLSFHSPPKHYSTNFFLLNYDTLYWYHVVYVVQTTEHKNQSGTKVIAIFSLFANIFLLLYVYFFSSFTSPHSVLREPAVFSSFRLTSKGKICSKVP